MIVVQATQIPLDRLLNMPAVEIMEMFIAANEYGERFWGWKPIGG